MNLDFSGIVLINKPSGITSHDVVAKIRKLYSTKQVGHTGTLDPMAKGLLVLLVGRAVKASDMITLDNKRYIAGLRLGIATDTEDTSGSVLESSDEIPSKAIVESCISSFVGKIKQVPPMYSAIKVNGQKLVDLARQGISVEREAREIEILSLSVDPTESHSDYILDVTCSKGTYIRTLCADIGKKLGCGGAMSSLKRISSGTFSLDNAYTLEELEGLSFDERGALLLPVESVFSSYPILKLPKFYERLALNGCEIYQKKIGSEFSVGERLRVYGDGGFYAVGEVFDYPDGSAVKLIKRF